MVLPLLAAAALRVGAGSAVRAGATRMGAGQAANSMGGRLASQAVGHYGVNALQRGAQNRQQGQQQRSTGWNSGFTRWVKDNPGEALASGTLAMTRGSTVADSAMDATNALLQSTQFTPKA
jgi:hypothetical protein